jgi:cysteinyl-tRNA synthetase
MAVLDKFDAVLAVIADHDAGPTQAAIAWAESQGLHDRIAPELLTRGGLTDAEVEALIAERNAARKQRNFKRSDEIRDELAAKGIVIEDSREGVRWKRK